jgi:hypothetical protein
MKKRILSIFLSVCMVLSLFSGLTVSAYDSMEQDEIIAESGEEGDTIIALDEDDPETADTPSDLDESSEEQAGISLLSDGTESDLMIEATALGLLDYTL